MGWRWRNRKLHLGQNRGYFGPLSASNFGYKPLANDRRQRLFLNLSQIKLKNKLDLR